MREALLQAGENFNHTLEVLLPSGCATHQAAQLQVFQHIQVRENAPAFRHMNHATLDHLARTQAGNFLTLETYSARERFVQRRDIVVERGLAHAIAAQHRNNLAGMNIQVYAAQYFNATVAGMQVSDLKHG